MPPPLTHRARQVRSPTDQLDAALSLRGWGGKAALYRDVFASVDAIRQIENARASAIIISHRNHEDTVKCLSLLKASEGARCEIIFVSNGVPRADLAFAPEFVDVFIQLNRNTGAFIARNIGALFSRSPILVFIEDDCVPHPDLLSAHVAAHERFNCISVRGVYEPKTDNPLNALATHYDLGDAIFPQHVVAEGNASYRSDMFYAVGGWDDQITFGGAGTDLAFRLLKIEPDMRRQIYYPKARIRHDYAVDEQHLLRKRGRQQGSFVRLQAKLGEYRMARWVYRKYLPAACASHKAAAPPLASPPRHPAVAMRSGGKRPLSLIVIDRALRPLSSNVEAIANLVRRDWDVVLVSSAEFTGTALEGIQHVTSCAGSEWDAIATAVKISRGDIVLFVDTATQLTADAIRSHIALYDEYDVIAVQGAVKAPGACDYRHNNWYPKCEFPTFANLPVNVSYARELLAQAMDGALLSESIVGPLIATRLLTLEPDFRKQIFSPRPAMMWDGLLSDGQSVKNRLPDYPSRDWNDLMMISRSLFGVAGLIPRHNCEREQAGRDALSRLFGEHHFDRAVARFLDAIGHYPEIAYGHFYLRFWSFLDICSILPDVRNGQRPSCDGQALFQRYKRKDLEWFTSSSPATPFNALALGPDCVDHQVIAMLTERARRIEELLTPKCQSTFANSPTDDSELTMGTNRYVI